jgi:hypothetical protein
MFPIQPNTTATFFITLHPTKFANSDDSKAFFSQENPAKKQDV